MQSDSTETIRQNNTWHRIDENSDTVIVFVHGFSSNSASCWAAKNGVYWPDLVVSDERLPRASVFLGGYHTSLNSSHYAVQDCGRELIGALRRKGPKGETPVMSRKNLIFVCHSLGGIVTRYIFEAYREDFSTKRVGLCLMASPSIGSWYAAGLYPIAKLFRNRTAEQLSMFNDFLGDLDDRFMRLLELRPDESFIGAEAIEHNPLFLSRLPWVPTIVGKLSAGRYFAERRVLPKTDHSSIVKPSSHSHDSHEFLIDLVVRLKIPAAICVNPTAQPEMAATSSQLDPLFDVYETRFERFYLGRDIDNSLPDHAALRSIWLSGVSGTGKTCALKRYIAGQQGRHIHLCLSQHGDGATREDLLREFAETFAQIDETSNVDPTYHSICAHLSKLNMNKVIIYVDEVSADTSAGRELLRLLIDILIAWKQHSDGRQLIFAVSSLTYPDFGDLPHGGKVYELFSFLDSPRWDDREIDALHRLITLELPQLTLTPDELLRVVTKTGGSPRYLKAFFRNLQFAELNKARDVEMALLRTSQQLGVYS